VSASRGREQLRAGDLVEVRSLEEIVATLDGTAAVDGVPFMPEMARFAGQRLRVRSRAHKTCDTARASGFRRLEETVHLADTRCDGSAHGGCQAECLLFWKTAWLKPVDDESWATDDAAAEPIPDLLERGTLGPPAEDGETVYSCQATRLREATTPLPWWDTRQYVADVGSGNVAPLRLLRGLALLLFNKFQSANRRFLPRLTLVRDGLRYPFVQGRVSGRTPTESLELQVGEVVRIKPKEQIEQTLDARNRNRGLLFDGVMSKYCGQTARVRSRIDHIIDENTGKMLHISPCVILDGVMCTGDYMQFCPRSIYDYWREIWLERV
jgi:hypothetical protein